GLALPRLPLASDALFAGESQVPPPLSRLLIRARSALSSGESRVWGGSRFPPGGGCGGEVQALGVAACGSRCLFFGPPLPAAGCPASPLPLSAGCSARV